MDTLSIAKELEQLPNNLKKEVFDFIELYKATLHKNQRVKVTCDLLGIDGYLQGVAQ